MKKTLIYIIGAGRSGTTLLDIMLGNNTDSISLGEVNRFFKRNGYPPNRDVNSKEYKFWETFRESISTKSNISFRRLNHLSRKNEYHSTVFKSLFKQNNKLYVKNLQNQYFSLSNQIEQSILIESSKYPVRALNISNYIDSNLFNVKYIYLKKNPIKVVESFQKKGLEQPTKNFFMANVYYLTVNILCYFSINILKRKGHRISVINFEELLNNTGETLNRMQEELDVDLQALIEKTNKNIPMKTGFLFDGNRIRLKETLNLQTLDDKVNKTSKYYFIRVFNYIVYR